MSDKPLDGLRLVTIAQYVPGPLAVARLVANGAAATKIEPPNGDPLEQLSKSWYSELHRGVEVERLDLRSDDGRARLHALLADADLLITSHRPSSLARLSLDPGTLRVLFPKLRFVAIVGSLAEPEVPGHDLTYQAEAGIIRDTLPLTLVGDVMASERVVSETLMLLRRPTGSVAEVGLVESLTPMVAPLAHGVTAPGGVLGGALPAYDVFETNHGHVAVAALEPHFERKLYDELTLPAKANLAPIMKTKSAAEWEAWGKERELPMVAVRTQL